MIYVHVDIKHPNAANVQNAEKFATIASFYGWTKTGGGEGKTAEIFLKELFVDDCKALLVRRVEHALAASTKIEAMKKEQERILNSNVLTELFGDSPA